MPCSTAKESTCVGIASNLQIFFLLLMKRKHNFFYPLNNSR